jgi:Plasmid encoded RepA protein
MAEVHSLIETLGKRGAIEQSVASRDVIEAAAAYLSNEDDALSFAYAGWAQCALPHRRIPIGQTWEMAYDKMRLVVEPGRRPTGPDHTGPTEPVEVPFGAYPRLILLYLQTEALRTNCREIELGNSWRDWMHRIGVSWGGNTGRAVREQAELLSRCRLTFHMSNSGQSGLINQSIVDKAIFIEASQSERQGRLSLESTKLSEGFFEALKKHPIPLEEAAIRALANNSAALDTYIWLAYRLHALPAPRMVTWKALKAQHGTGYRNLHHFKPRFVGILAMAIAVYPEAKIEIIDEGVILKPSRPPVAPRLVASRGGPAPRFSLSPESPPTITDVIVRRQSNSR